MVQLPISQAAGQNAVQVRFHYTGQSDQWWAVDNVWLGLRSCQPVPGGLVVGRVTDRNNGNGLVGGDVSGTGTVATPDDANLGDGAYWRFTPSGSQQLTATAGRFYQAQTKTVDVTPDAATRADFDLAAGRLAFSTTAVSSTQVLGTSATRPVTITNTGSAPATVDLVEQAAPAGIDPPAPAADCTVTVAGDFSPLRTGAAQAGPPAATPADAPWQPIPHYPAAITDNSAAYGDGAIYSVGGLDGTGTVVASGYAYHPNTQTWTAIAPIPHARQKPAVAFVGGELVATGGWDQTGATITSTDVYDPATNRWTSGRPVPHAYAGADVAVLDGRMYVVGGCTDECGNTDVAVYDPSTDTWTAVAPYPRPVGWEACAGVAGKVYCTGGLYQISEFTSTYAYDPTTNHWSPAAPLPIPLWGGAYAAAGGQLIVSGGITPGTRGQTHQPELPLRPGERHLDAAGRGHLPRLRRQRLRVLQDRRLVRVVQPGRQLRAVARPGRLRRRRRRAVGRRGAVSTHAGPRGVSRRDDHARHQRRRPTRHAHRHCRRRRGHAV